MNWPNKPQPDSDLGIMGSFIICMLFFSGCVSVSQNKRDVNEAYIRGLQKARTIAHYQHCSDAVALINKTIARGAK